MTKTEMLAAKESWVKWLATYGADKFFEAFIDNAQNAVSTCVYCGEQIYLDIAEGGGVPDWATNAELGGDYGCVDSPDTCDEGTGGHFPDRRPASTKQLLEHT